MSSNRQTDGLDATDNYGNPRCACYCLLQSDWPTQFQGAGQCHGGRVPQATEVSMDCRMRRSSSYSLLSVRQTGPCETHRPGEACGLEPRS